jgi:TatD DNase family protein
MLIDAMAHLNDPRTQDLESVLERAHAAGITDIINAGVNPCTDLAVPNPRSPQIHKAYGIHPMVVGQVSLDVQLTALKTRLSEDNVVAMGEIGLDKRDGMPAMELQEAAFRAQLNLARQMNLPVILHAVKASGPLLTILQEGPELPAGGVWHGYSGSIEVAKQIEQVGLHISIGGQVSYPNSKKCRLSARAIRADRLLVESDSPDHPPLDWGHPQSEPASIQKNIEEIAALRGEAMEAIAKQTYENAARLFRIG